MHTQKRKAYMQTYILPQRDREIVSEYQIGRAINGKIDGQVDRWIGRQVDG